MQKYIKSYLKLSVLSDFKDYHNVTYSWADLTPLLRLSYPFQWKTLKKFYKNCKF